MDETENRLTDAQMSAMMQDIFRGQSTEDVINAMATLLAGAIGQTVETLEDAETVVEDVAEQILKSIHKNWDYLTRLRAGSGSTHS